MEVLPQFDLLRPRDLAEAARLLADPQAQVLGGGTDLITNLRHGLGSPRALVDLSGIAGFDGLEVSSQGLKLGAGLRLARLAASAEVQRLLPVIAEAAVSIAGPAHRNIATVGGNLCLDTRCVFYNQAEWWRKANDYCLKYRGDICHVAPTGKRCQAAYSGDLAPALLALGARVEIVSATGTRTIPLAELYHEDGAKHLTLAAGEFLASIAVPAPAPGLRCAYRKNRVRGAVDFPLAGVAMALVCEAGVLKHLAVALTGTNSRPFLLAGTGELLGKAVDEAALKAIEKLVAKQVTPMRTTVTASNYRRIVAGVMARRLLRDLAGG